MDVRLTLERRIREELRSYDGKMSIYIDDLKGNVITCEPDEVFETASTIKVFILASLFEKVENKTASLSDKLRYCSRHYVEGSGILRSLEQGTTLSVKDVATLMIIVSDNIATNMMIEYLGLDDINACIGRIGCAHTTLYNPIDFRKYDGIGVTTARDYAHIFTQIAKSELISERASAQMLAILRQQHYNRMLTKCFPQSYLDSEDLEEEELLYVASKSGSMDACRNDGGIVFTPYGKYVIVLLSKDFHDPVYYPEHPATVFGARISRMVLDQYLALEGKLIIEK